jgi:LEA14-like dessication related protein
MLKKLNRIITMTAVATLISSCAAIKEAVKEPEVSVTDMQVKAISLSDMKVDFTLGVKNPNPLGISLSGMRYKLDIDDKSLLSGDSRQKMKVKANSSSSVTLPLSINYKDLSGGIGALLKKDKVAYALSGDLDFGLFRIPYKKQGVLDLPSMPKVSVASMKVDRMKLSGMDVTVVLQVVNNNSFPVKLDGIHYGLKVADTTLLSGGASQPLSLEPNASGRLPVGISLSYGNLGNVANSILKGKSVPIAFDGEMAIPGAGSVPVSWHGEVPVTR